MGSWIAGAVGFVILIWLATTSFAPLVVILLVVALLYQVGHANIKA